MKRKYHVRLEEYEVLKRERAELAERMHGRLVELRGGVTEAEAVAAAAAAAARPAHHPPGAARLDSGR